MKKRRFHTIVLGSGAAGLAAAVRLHAEGVTDIVILTEGLDQGTSINTGSDKQTYYKQGLYGNESDSPALMAASYTSAGSTHGDLAMTESAVSTRAFFHLANLGVPFPHDETGQYIGYKTDHDPRRRATSCGPYTSREMCRALIHEVKARAIDVREGRVAVKLVVARDHQNRRHQVVGVLTINTESGELEVWRTNRIVFAVGGPGGLYQSSVYPAVHTGAIGLALEVGAKARNLPESQFGLASFTDISKRDFVRERGENEILPAPVDLFRWNVSGTFMQVLPRFISTDDQGNGPVEFLRPWFESIGSMNSNVFLKGYQWPFDVRKVTGSSLIDLIVYYETVVRGRRVFLDFRSNPDGTRFEELAPEAYEYLEKSDALFGTPLERLKRMNPGAFELYRDHGIDLAEEPLEIAVCSQHNNGGLAGDTWFQSENVSGLFPIGEVNGSHGVARPGGSALNAGQVGAFRAAEYIAHDTDDTIDEGEYDAILQAQYNRVAHAIFCLNNNPRDWKADREQFQRRMSRSGSHFRSSCDIGEAVAQAWSQFDSMRLESDDTMANVPEDVPPATKDTVESLRNLQLCLAHAVYLESIEFQLRSGVGSRGSGAVINEDGETIHPGFPPEWKFVPENESFRKLVLETRLESISFFCAPDERLPSRCCKCDWQSTRPLPATDDWFEQVWTRYRNDEIFRAGETE